MLRDPMQGPSDEQELVTMQPELVTMQQPELVILSSSSVVSIPVVNSPPDKPATSSSDYVDVRVYEKLMYKCLIV